MNDTNFVDLLTDDNIKRINIDPRLIEAFKNVMIKIQEYFNKTGISSKVNFKEMFENYLLSKTLINKEEILQSDKFKKYVDDIKNFYKEINVSDLENELDIEHLYNNYLAENGILSICVDKDNRGAGKYRNNIISVNVNELSKPSELEHTICHEFIHHITMCGKEQYGSVSYNLPSFACEALTEMITQDIVFGKQQDYFNEVDINGKNGNAYSQWCQLMRFINDYYKIQDYDAFLVLRSSDDRYKDILDRINEIVSEKFSSFNPNDRYVDEELLDKTQNIVIANMLTDIINSPNIDISTFVEKMLLFDKIPFKNLSETPSKMSNYIIDYYCNKNNIDKENIVELLSLERKLKQYDGEDVFEFEQDSLVTIAFTKEGKAYRKVAGKYATNIIPVAENDYFSPHYVDQQNHTIHFFSENGSFDYNLNSIDFSKRKKELLSEKEKILKKLNQNRDNTKENKMEEEASIKAQEIARRNQQLQAEKQKQIKQNNDIRQVEQLLNIRISPTKTTGYVDANGQVHVSSKNTSELSIEESQIKAKLNELYTDNKIDLRTRNGLQIAVINQYTSMRKNAPKPTIISGKTTTQSHGTKTNDYEERTQEEQQIVIDQKKASKFRPIISETVKKSVELHDKKQKLHEMKEQLLDYQEQKSMNQEAEYEEEESHGMSM